MLKHEVLMPAAEMNPLPRRGGGAEEPAYCRLDFGVPDVAAHVRRARDRGGGEHAEHEHRVGETGRRAVPRGGCATA